MRAAAFFPLLAVCSTHAAAQRLAVSIQTYAPHHHLVETGRRSWRAGVTTVVITNGTTEERLPSPDENEVWFQMPDMPSIGCAPHAVVAERSLVSLPCAHA
jgi:hypothetical protein